MKIAFFTVALSALSNICVTASSSAEPISVDSSRETGVTKRAELAQKAASAFPWPLALLPLLVTYEIGVQKLAQKIAANKGTQYTDTNETLSFKNSQDLPIPLQAKRLADKIAKANWSGSPNNDTGVVIIPRNDIEESNLFTKPYSWFAVTFARSNGEQKDFDVFASNSGYLLFHTVTNLLDDRYYFAGSAHPTPAFAGPTLPGVKRVLMNVTFGADSNGYWHTYKLNKKKK